MCVLGTSIFIKTLRTYPRSIAIGCHGQIFIVDSCQKTIHTVSTDGQDLPDLQLSGLDLDPSCEIVDIFGGHANYLHVWYQTRKHSALQCYELGYLNLDLDLDLDSSSEIPAEETQQNDP